MNISSDLRFHVNGHLYSLVVKEKMTFMLKVNWMWEKSVPGVNI